MTEKEREIRRINNSIKFHKQKLDELSAALTEVTKDLAHCHGCNHWFEKDELVVTHERKTSCETISWDCGYGDDDVLADVTRLWTYRSCPKCMKRLKEDSTYISSTNERTRR